MSVSVPYESNMEGVSVSVPSDYEESDETDLDSDQSCNSENIETENMYYQNVFSLV